MVIHVAGCLRTNPETLRLWKNRANIEASRATGTTSEVELEIKRLKKQIVELEKANEIPRSASAFFATELSRPLASHWQPLVGSRYWFSVWVSGLSLPRELMTETEHVLRPG